MMSVQEAAALLELSPQRIRQIAAEGKLGARKFGSVWVLDRDAVRATRRIRPAPRQGRRLSARSAWAVLSLLDGEELKGYSRSEIQRARVRASEIVDSEPGYLAARAQGHAYRAHPGVLKRLAFDDRFVLGGLLSQSDADPAVVAHDLVEGYVRRANLGGIVSEYGLAASSAYEANVVIRVPNGRWPLGERGRVPEAGAAADLIDSADPRSIEAGRAIFRRLVDAFESERNT